MILNTRERRVEYQRAYPYGHNLPLNIFIYEPDRLRLTPGTKSKTTFCDVLMLSNRRKNQLPRVLAFGPHLGDEREALLDIVGNVRFPD